jgi:hypothetical protein
MDPPGVACPVQPLPSNFMENLISGNKMDLSKAKWTFYFSEWRKNTPSDPVSTP